MSAIRLRNVAAGSYRSSLAQRNLITSASAASSVRIAAVSRLNATRALSGTQNALSAVSRLNFARAFSSTPRALGTGQSKCSKSAHLPLRNTRFLCPLFKYTVILLCTFMRMYWMKDRSTKSYLPQRTSPCLRSSNRKSHMSKRNLNQVLNPISSKPSKSKVYGRYVCAPVCFDSVVPLVGEWRQVSCSFLKRQLIACFFLMRSYF